MNYLLDGYKTYIAGFAGIIVAVLSQIFGWFDLSINVELLIGGFGLIGLRRAIK